MRKLLLILALAICSICFDPQMTHAQQSADPIQISVSPTTQRITIAENKTVKDSFTVLNVGSDAFNLSLYAQPYRPADETYEPIFGQETARTQIARWTVFDKKQYRLEPGQKMEVPYSVVVPATIPDGSQYMVIFAETYGQREGSIISKKRIGMLVYAKPTGKTIETGTATFGTLSPWQLGQSIRPTVRVTNTGNTDYDSTVKVSVKRLFGNTKQEIFADNRTKLVFPDTTRPISISWQDAAPLGLYVVTQSATIAGTTTSKDSIVLITSPVISIIAIIVLSIFISVIAVAAVQHRRHRKLRAES